MKKNKWGGYCPRSLSFNYTRFRNNKCELWQYKFFHSWYTHGIKGKISEEFKDFSVAYEWLTEDYPFFSTFISKAKLGHDWEWETDASGTHQFDRYMQYVPRSFNIQQAELDNPDMGRKSYLKRESPEYRKKVAMGKGHSVVAISPTFEVVEYYGTREAERELGISHSTIVYCCRCKGGSHTLKQGKFKNWSFYWKEDYNTILK